MRVASSGILVAALLGYSAGPAWSGEKVARLSWDEVSTATAHAEFFPKVRVQRRTAPDWIKARLLEVTDTGLRLAVKNRETFVGRGEIRSLRLFPRKAGHRRNREIAVIVAAPVAFGAMLGTWAVICSTGACSESGGGLGALSLPAGIAVPYLLYKRAWKADRGSVRIIVQEP